MKLEGFKKNRIISLERQCWRDPNSDLTLSSLVRTRPGDRQGYVERFWASFNAMAALLELVLKSSRKKIIVRGTWPFFGHKIVHNVGKHQVGREILALQL